ncbi:MAG TPA: MqnA/MqnD/SBP family protein [Thermoanaerobaculia bacterium]|jgi:1,4-dihydroxy-6-naphthoate synthase|nr:MqnA/MqnD/SBP family protein [Thermoanaerobaculia bacterium]
MTETATRTVHIAHSPDSDDAFMFWALSQGVLDTEGIAVEHVLADIETLNQAAFQGRYEVTALSLHAYAYLHDRYQLMPSGASFGDGYGPVVVAKQRLTREDLAGAEVAIPGKLTTAALALRLWQPAVATRIVPFDQVLDVVARGEAVAGVVIHEGQLTYGEQGLHAVVDLGAWWKEETGGPLPLGANGIRRDLPEDTKRLLCRLLRESIDCGLERRQEALDYALRYARGIEDDRARADRFVGMYVNEWTRDYGEAGRAAVQGLLDRGHAAGLLPARVVAEFVAG